MRLEDEQESTNVEDRRGVPSRRVFTGRGSLGLWTIVLALIAAYFGFDPRIVLGLLEGSSPLLEDQPSISGPQPPPARDEMGVFVAKVLGTTEGVWQQVFAGMGQRYVEPTLVLYSGATPSACGLGRAAMGPFYCPGDQKVYVDLAFFGELRDRYGAPGDFARAYVLAHEVGHHVQYLLGITEKILSLQEQSGPKEANQLSVRLELQADCLAGVWANRVHEMRNILEPDDVEEGLKAASAVGDDNLQNRSKGYVVPESFTHGTSAERAGWFHRGLQSGTLEGCNTFGG